MVLLVNAGQPHTEGVTQRFTADCELCAELLTDYIAAGNAILDTKRRSADRPEPTAGQLAVAMLERAMKRKSQARQRLSDHKRHQHSS